MVVGRRNETGVTLLIFRSSILIEGKKNINKIIIVYYFHFDKCELFAIAKFTYMQSQYE